ncbi:MAG: ribbon-helix-helix domain-containing protein [Sarcina sp.]
MAKIKKNGLKYRTPIGSAMDNKIYYEMKKYSEETGIPVSKILDKAMSMYLNTIQ